MGEEIKETEVKSTETMADYADQIDRSMRKVNVGDILSGTVIDVNEEEIVLDLQYYAEGVIRAEDYSDDPSVTALDEVKVGQEMSGVVLKRDDGNGRILMSKKEANAVLSWERLSEYKKTGKNVKVKVQSVVNKGVVAYLEGIRGFIPASKLSLSYVEEDDLEKFVGKIIEVRVITVDEEDKKLVMSAKEILMEEREEQRRNMISNVEVGLVTEGVVESIQSYGAFVRLADGLSGLLHVSQISHAHVKHPAAVLKEGDKIKVKIIAVKDGKISLSKKVLEEATATEVSEEEVELPKSEEIGTSLGSLLAGLKLS